MSDLHDRELADTLARDRDRHATREHRLALTVDRKTPRWERIRGALCPVAGIPESLDSYADNVVRALENTNARTGSILESSSAGAGKGGL